VENRGSERTVESAPATKQSENLRASHAKLPRWMTVVIVVVILCVAVVIVDATTAIMWVGGCPVRVTVIRNGKLVPAQAIHSIEYFTSRDQKTCDEIMHSLENGGDALWRKAIVEDGDSFIGARASGTTDYLAGC
jgi:hypothetical protein